MIKGLSASPRRFQAFLRRYLHLWCLLLTLLLFLIVESLPPRQPGFSLRNFPGSSYLGSNHKPDILRPGDLSGRTHQHRPADDQAPDAHEPIGPGTLRDVREEGFYLGGTSTVTMADGHSHPKPAIYDPYPDYNGEEWAKAWQGTFRACEGPRARTLSRQNAEDMVVAYPGIQKDFPFPIYGSYESLELDGYSCTTRFSRLRAYGYEDADSDLHLENTDFPPPARVDWDAVNWGMLQSQCLERNADRYTPIDQPRISHILPLKQESAPRAGRDSNDDSSPPFKSRAAVVLRAWHDMTWTENTKHYVRSLVMELSLHSGAEYEVYLLTHVKDNEIPLYTADGKDDAQRLKEKFTPPEFWYMTVFFNEETLRSWYPDVEEHRPSYQHLQPLQIFSVLFPEFDYFWQLEMDARLTGHTYHFFERASEFAKRQPRKYLWERNAYSYIPGAHGPWDAFKTMVDGSITDKPSIWGPVRSDQSGIITPLGPEPPVPRPEDDNYEWGASEEADLITLLPIFDPAETKWIFSDTLWNLPREHTARRAAPITMGRYSSLLLNAIHTAQTEKGIALASEMTAPSFALWHGLKAVHVPQPLYADGKWTPKELARIVNKGPPEKINGASDSIWNWDHKFDHILYRISYMFTAQTAEDFYRRWLGYGVDGAQYTDGSYHQDPQGRNWFDGGNLREDLYGPLCFPPMFLHPVKNTARRKGPDMAVPV